MSDIKKLIWTRRLQRMYRPALLSLVLLALVSNLIVVSLISRQNQRIESLAETNVELSGIQIGHINCVVRALTASDRQPTDEFLRVCMEMVERRHQ